MTGWNTRWHGLIGSGVSARSGSGWEFTSPSDKADAAWAVFREDGGPFPVFSAARGPGPLPPTSDLLAMTTDAVDDLFRTIDPEHNSWLRRNLTAGLLLASRDVDSWEGEEWALESGADDQPLAWANPSDLRTPYAWLRANSPTGSALIDIYQDEGVFGLSFVTSQDRELPAVDVGSLRSRRNIPLVTGPITQVEIVVDTLVEGSLGAGVITEALLRSEADSTLLIAAEAYSRDEWHLYDESVVAVSGLAAADGLRWIPERTRWRSTSVRRESSQ